MRVIARVNVAGATDGAAVANRAGMGVWNLPHETQAEVSLAHANLALNRCVNHQDASIDVNQPVRIAKALAGRYDLRLGDRKPYICYTCDAAFAPHDEDLTDCTL